MSKKTLAWGRFGRFGYVNQSRENIVATFVRSVAVSARSHFYVFSYSKAGLQLALLNWFEKSRETAIMARSTHSLASFVEFC